MARRDLLAPYRAKRDFTRTSEPSGDDALPGNSDPIFIVQKHDATRLHWDFRIEVDGVLKSWAVTRGPSIDPADKRLAVRTEDHPMSYAHFEGNIPKGEYGGGTVMLWDQGHWAPVEGKSAKDIDKGHLHFRLSGERMKGEWLLVADLGLVSFALLSGGKGVHVTVPLRPAHDWEVHKDFAKRFAEAMALSEPDRFTATMSKAKRKGRIFIDWLRNQRGSTAVLPYSARAREGAPVAVPIDWDELEGMEHAHPFGISDADALIERAQGKALKGWDFADQTLPGV